VHDQVVVGLLEIPSEHFCAKLADDVADVPSWKQLTITTHL
jgi:hypothetical protein